VDKTGTARILHIEDDPVDAELISLALQRAGLPCDIHLASSRKECLAALESGEFDLVLSDSHGHDFKDLDILRLVHDHLPDIPFIFLSGSFDDRDPETLKAEGATECLLKDDLDELAPAIKRVLQDRK
jgi:CheY-like chemotaxis protein